MIGQQRQMEIEPLFACELCAVPPSLIDEHRCLRKATSQTLSNVLGYMRPYHVSLWSFICLQAVYQLSGPVCKATWSGCPSYSVSHLHFMFCD